MKKIDKTMIELLNELETDLGSFSKQSILEEGTRYCWVTLNKQNEKDEYFIRAFNWFCFIAIAKGIDSYSQDFMNENRRLELATKLIDFLTKAIDPQNCRKLIDPFVHDLDRLSLQFANYLIEKKIRDNHLQNLHSLSKEERVKIFQCLTYASDTKIKNMEVESRYYWSDPGLAVKKSLFLAERLDTQLNNEKIRKKLNNKSYVNNFCNDKLGCSSIHKFQERLFLIFEIFRYNQGIVKGNEIATYLKNFQENNLDKKEIELLEKDILRIIVCISITDGDIKLAYNDHFKRNLRKKETLFDNQNPFYDKPIFQYEKDERIIFICPSPYLLLIKIGQLFSLLFYQYNQSLLKNVIGEDEKNNIEKDVRRVNDQIGKAHESYINDCLDHYSKKGKFEYYDLEKEERRKITLKKNEQHKSRADFLIETNNYIFLVECKNSIGLRDAFYKPYIHPKEPHPLFSTWNRLTGSFNQCYETENNLSETFLDKGKKVFYLVVVNEMVLAEAAVFGMYVYYAKDPLFISNLNLTFGKFSMVSLPVFDYLIASDSLEKFVQTCEEKAQLVYNESDENTLFNRICAALNIMSNVNKKYDTSFWSEKEWQ